MQEMQQNNVDSFMKEICNEAILVRPQAVDEAEAEEYQRTLKRGKARPPSDFDRFDKFITKGK